MDSFSKIPLSASIARDIVSYHFGTDRKLAAFEELREGFFNAAALLELDDGLKCVLKAAPPAEVQVLRYEKDLMRAEVESMRLVRSRTQVPVPEIFVYDTTRRLLPSEFFLMEYVPGVPFHKLQAQLSEQARQDVRREMGRMTHEMAQISGPAFGYWAQPGLAGASWRDCFAEMLHGVMQDGLDVQVDLERPYEEIRQILQKNFATLEEVVTPCLVHWDLWDGNVIVEPQSGQVTGLIDFERVMWADPLIEMIFMDLDPNSPAAAGYGEPLFKDPAQITRRLLYNAYLYLIMVIECTYRKYPNQDQENWARPRLRNVLQQLACQP
jgi:aminoglycoside phosphotransferase (APT) family kinase protein